MATLAQPTLPSQATGWDSLTLSSAEALSGADVLGRLQSSSSGLSQEEASARLAKAGPNALRSHGARPLEVLGRQLHNPLLILLVAASVTSYVTGERTSAVIILAIIAMSVGLGFYNEYRSELAVQALHSKLHHTALVMRDGKFVALDVTQLVPGDVVRLSVGDVVPADLRVLQADGLECDEGVLTGESLPAEKRSDPSTTPPESPLALPSCAFMGTVVRAGSGLGVIVVTGARTAFGAIAVQLGERQPETAFQVGLRDFSMMLVRVTGVLAGSILVLNLLLGRSFLETLLFALAIAVGLTPQLLPAIVTISLSTGAKRLAEQSVIVKRLVSIEDLGNIMVLFTDKTGTLTEGSITYAAALDGAGQPSEAVLRAGLLCNDATFSDGRVIGGNQLDQALWAAPGAGGVAAEHTRRLAELPFDYQRRLASVLVEDGGGRQIIVKGAPETVLARCSKVPPQAQAVLDGQFAAGSRVIAVATRAADDRTTLSAEDEHDLDLAGFLTFVDRPKANVGKALDKLKKLEVELKIITGDNERVAQKVCADIGLAVDGILTGAQLDELDDPKLAAALPKTTIFARVTPEQKSRIIKGQRALGSTVGFLGDGVNDAVALHDADVGISVESATDVAKDAADIVLLNKDLGILAGGVVEGRRIFANTMKYILMGTSSNFGNMFSAAGASLILSFLPMLPEQILLNNLLYDTSEMTIPTDNVDEEQLERPAHWDIGFIRHFMVLFGPISSIFDFATFGIMIWVFHAHAPLFRSGWFVESLSTQSLVIFVIRTRRIPFFHSKASTPLIVSTLICVAIGIALPYSPFAHALGFTALPLGFMGALVVMIIIYLGLVELGKRYFYRTPRDGAPLAKPHREPEKLIRHRATRWSIRGHLHAGTAAHRVQGGTAAHPATTPPA